MASTQRPKFRTTNGCCICRRKSSSSRFAPSIRWEKYFDACFKLNGEVRSGLICNACVLIVKRYKAYLPTGQDATWSYVVDCRLGPGTKNMSKIKKKMTNCMTSLPYSASDSEQIGFDSTDGYGEDVCSFADFIPCPLLMGKSRRTTILFSRKKQQMRGPNVMRHGMMASGRKFVPWSDLIMRRVKVPPQVPVHTHPEVEGYQTCCGIIYISPDCSKIWAQEGFFRSCQRLHPTPGRLNCYQESGCPAFAARVSELHSEISSQKKFGSADSLSYDDYAESPCTPSTVTSDAGVEMCSDGSAHSMVTNSHEFSEHDDFGTNPSSPASNVGLYQDEPYDLTATAKNVELLSHRQPLTLSAAMSLVKTCFPFET